MYNMWHVNFDYYVLCYYVITYYVVWSKNGKVYALFEIVAIIFTAFLIKFIFITYTSKIFDSNYLIKFANDRLYAIYMQSEISQSTEIWYLLLIRIKPCCLSHCLSVLFPSTPRLTKSKFSKQKCVGFNMFAERIVISYRTRIEIYMEDDTVDSNLT